MFFSGEPRSVQGLFWYNITVECFLYPSHQPVLSSTFFMLFDKKHSFSVTLNYGCATVSLKPRKTVQHTAFPCPPLTLKKTVMLVWQRLKSRTWTLWSPGSVGHIQPLWSTTEDGNILRGRAWHYNIVQQQSAKRQNEEVSAKSHSATP